MKQKGIPLEEIDSVEAFNRHTRIVEREQIRRRLLAENMKDFTEMFETQQYKAFLGDETAPWGAYLSEVDVYYTRSRVDMWRRIFAIFTQKLGIVATEYCDIPESRLYDLTTVKIKNIEEAKEWFGKARTLTPQDFRDETREAKGLPISDECKHDFKNFEICSHCGLRHVK